MRLEKIDGLLTLFYDGSEELYNQKLDDELEKAYNKQTDDDDQSLETWESWDLSNACKKYYRRRQSWQQIVVVELVTVIPRFTFKRCKNIRRVIFANTVIRIEECAFHDCNNLVYIKWSMNLLFIGDQAFDACDLLSIFIPPRCEYIGFSAFSFNESLTILNVPQTTELSEDVAFETELTKEAPVEVDEDGSYLFSENAEVNYWIKNINSEEKYSLHRICCSFYPLIEDIYTIVEAKGPGAFMEENNIGITPSRYLEENPYAGTTELDIMRDYIITMMGDLE